MASPPPATWSLNACLSYRGLEIRAAAENVLPGWGHGGERLSILLRLRHRLRLAVTSQCGCPPALAEHGKKPRALKLLSFLRSRLARAPRVPSILRRKKPPRAAVAMPGSRTPAIPSFLDRVLMRPPATRRALCFLAALAVAAASMATLRIMAGFVTPNTICASWRCFLAKKFVKLLGPRLFGWLSRISLQLIKFLDPPVELGLKWLLNK